MQAQAICWDLWETCTGTQLTYKMLVSRCWIPALLLVYQELANPLWNVRHVLYTADMTIIQVERLRLASTDYDHEKIRLAHIYTETLNFLRNMTIHFLQSKPSICAQSVTCSRPEHFSIIIHGKTGPYIALLNASPALIFEYGCYHMITQDGLDSQRSMLWDVESMQVCDAVKLRAGLAGRENRTHQGLILWCAEDHTIDQHCQLDGWWNLICAGSILNSKRRDCHFHAWLHSLQNDQEDFLSPMWCNVQFFWSDHWRACKFLQMHETCACLTNITIASSTSIIENYAQP